MYNEELKRRFMNEHTDKESTRKSYEYIFKTTEPYEIKWGADVCTRTAVELQEVIDDLAGTRLDLKSSKIISLKNYIKWCVRNGVEGARDEWSQIQNTGLNKIKTSMVSFPGHLQKCLNELYDEESMQTLDNVYRCFYWLAYSGMKEEDIFNVKNEDIDLVNLVVKYKNDVYPIYKEALPCIRNCMTLKSFYFNHPLYSSDKNVWKDRAPGNTLVRVLSGTCTIKSFRSLLSTKVIHESKGVISGVPRKVQKLGYNRVWRSGMFYRIYEQDLLGFPLDFTEMVEVLFDGKTSDKPNYITYRKHAVTKSLHQDYLRWKEAFFE